MNNKIPNPIHDTKAALDALDRFDGMTFNGNIEAWQKLGQLLDGHRNTIRAALSVQSYTHSENVHTKTPNTIHDRQAAFDALAFVCRTLGWLEVVPPYGDAVSRTKECDTAIKQCETIRAALTTQLTKTDDNVSCPSVANAGDINAELLEALRSLLSAFDNEGLNAGYHAYVYKAKKAIARAEQNTRPPMCHANRDGECVHPNCPQLRDNEPSTSGRHCPLDVEED